MCTLGWPYVEKYDHLLLLKHLPSDLKQFLEHIQSFGYADKPDYAMLASLFECCMKRCGVKDSDPFDWEKIESAANSEQSNSSSNMQSAIQMKNNEPVHGNITQMTVAVSNGSGMEYVSIGVVYLQLSSFYSKMWCIHIENILMRHTS